jgi:hypothetical protein
MRASALLVAFVLAAAVPAEAQEPAPKPTQQERTETFAKLPYWPGYWVSERQAGTTIGGAAPALLEARKTGQFPANFMSMNGGAAPWNEDGKKRFADARAASRGRKAQGWGYPMMMDSATPIQFLITPEEVIIINAYNETRHIYTDGRPMPSLDDLWPTVTGTSIGHWEGDTLVIETIQVTNPNHYFHGAPPLSEEARYVERIRMDGDMLTAEVTVTDPVTLTGPWNVHLSWVRDEGFDRMVLVDWDNDRSGSDGEFNTIEPSTVEDGQ